MRLGIPLPHLWPQAVPGSNVQRNLAEDMGKGKAISKFSAYKYGVMERWRLGNRGLDDGLSSQA